ncbi:hypothetical protein ACFE04_002778 [Oxalis oulophora]
MKFVRRYGFHKVEFQSDHKTTIKFLKLDEWEVGINEKLTSNCQFKEHLIEFLTYRDSLLKMRDENIQPIFEFRYKNVSRKASKVGHDAADWAEWKESFEGQDDDDDDDDDRSQEVDNEGVSLVETGSLYNNYYGDNSSSEHVDGSSNYYGDGSLNYYGDSSNYHGDGSSNYYGDGSDYHDDGGGSEN